MRGLAISALFVTQLVGCEAGRLDQQMEELCKKDGGVKVYEAVKVPAEWLDFAGHPSVKTFPRQNVGGGISRQSVAGLYLIEKQNQVIKSRSNDDRGLYVKGRLNRSRIIVLRISDNKILGEEVSYGRSGGDVSLGHSSSNSCPSPRPNPDVVQSVFLKDE